jgi:hypothetical protein
MGLLEPGEAQREGVRQRRAARLVGALASLAAMHVTGGMAFIALMAESGGKESEPLAALGWTVASAALLLVALRLLRRLRQP